jgi:hypothetical protein
MNWGKEIVCSEAVLEVSASLGLREIFCEFFSLFSSSEMALFLVDSFLFSF